MGIIIVNRPAAAAADAAVLTQDNKDMPARVTVNDGDLACDTAITNTPSNDCYVMVMLNGRQQGVSDGPADVNNPFYFSADGGTTARTISDIAAGDSIYFRGSVYGRQLNANDLISFNYQV